MPAKDTSSRSISITRASYDKIYAHCQRHQISMRSLLEAWIDEIAPTPIAAAEDEIARNRLALERSMAAREQSSSP